MTTVQMNTRLDSELKARGDAALANCGYSPSEAVRLLWGFAARNWHDQRALSEMIDYLANPHKAGRKQAEQMTLGNWAARGPAIIDGFRQQFDPLNIETEATSCEELDEALSDILEEDAARIAKEADCSVGAENRARRSE